MEANQEIGLPPIAEVELSYHPVDAGYPYGVTIKASRDAYNVFNRIWNHSTISLYEEMYCLLVNRANNVLGVILISRGGVTGTVVDSRIIFAAAVKSVASGIILAHNHPSGSLKPSEADKDLAIKIQKGAKLLDMALLDNLIITSNGYFSFADEGMV